MHLLRNRTQIWLSASEKCLNPKHVIQRALKLPSISHTWFFDITKLYKPLPLFAVFCDYEVAYGQSRHENNMSGANTKSVLARFRDNNWEKGRDFVKTFFVKKLMWEREGSLSKHVIQRALKLPSISHTCFFDTTKLNIPLPLFAVFLRLRSRPISARKQHVGS